MISACKMRTLELNLVNRYLDLVNLYLSTN